MNAIVSSAVSAAKLAIYPVGSIYMSVNATSPATLFGGTWVQLSERFLLGASSTYPAGGTGGEATHTLTVNEMPSHNHGMEQSGTDGERTMAMGVDGSSASDHYLAFGSSVKSFSESYITIGYTGGSRPHNNMPPYLAVYMWKRTA